MKKNLFLHASKAVAGAFVLLLAFTACQKDIKREVASEEILLSTKGSKTSLSPVSLQVTIENFEGAKITSDGSAYINGQQNVKAVIDEHGNFLFNTQLSSTVNVQRSWVYNFNDPNEPANNSYIPTVDPSKMVNLNMIKSNFKPFVALQNLAKNATQCVGLGGGFTALSNQKTHHISFHRSLEDTETSPTSYAVVTRTKTKSEDGVDEWIIESAGTCSPNSNIASLRSGSGTRRDPTVLHGYYNILFKFTLTSVQ